MVSNARLLSLRYAYNNYISDWCILLVGRYFGTKQLAAMSRSIVYLLRCHCHRFETNGKKKMADDLPFAVIMQNIKFDMDMISFFFLKNVNNKKM